MHDARMLAASHLHGDLENFAYNPAGREMCLYGDPAYPLRFLRPGTIPIWNFNKVNAGVQ